MIAILDAIWLLVCLANAIGITFLFVFYMSEAWYMYKDGRDELRALEDDDTRW